MAVSAPPDPSVSGVDPQPDQASDFAVPPEMSQTISRASTFRDITNMLLGVKHVTKSVHYISAWIGLHGCLEHPNVGNACECPFVYFFVKRCLDQGWGVPKLALTVYDRMNMLLSREFIRCANPTCELNKLDKSTGKVKFKQCSRCKTGIYCSRECQVAHYPEHKRLCREHPTV